MDNCKKKLLDFAVHNIDYWKEGFSHLRTKIEPSDENSLFFTNDNGFVNTFRNNEDEEGWLVNNLSNDNGEKVDSLIFECEEPTFISREEWIEERVKVLNHEMNELKRSLNFIRNCLVYS